MYVRIRFSETRRLFHAAGSWERWQRGAQDPDAQASGVAVIGAPKTWVEPRCIGDHSKEAMGDTGSHEGRGVYWLLLGWT